MVNEYHWYPSDGLNNKFNKKDDMKQDEDEDRDWLSKERKTTLLFCQFCNNKFSRPRMTFKRKENNKILRSQTKCFVSNIEPYQKG